MAQQSAHYDIYREELGRAYPGFGYALWDPSPEEHNPSVEVGDISKMSRTFPSGFRPFSFSGPSNIASSRLLHDFHSVTFPLWTGPD